MMPTGICFFVWVSQRQRQISGVRTIRPQTEQKPEREGSGQGELFLPLTYCSSSVWKHIASLSSVLLQPEKQEVSASQTPSIICSWKTCHIYRLFRSHCCTLLTLLSLKTTWKKGNCNLNKQVLQMFPTLDLNLGLANVTISDQKGLDGVWPSAKAETSWDHPWGTFYSLSVEAFAQTCHFYFLIFFIFLQSVTPASKCRK